MYRFTLIKREFFGSSRFTVLFIANLCIGLLGFTVLDAFKRDFSKMLMAASKTMMTADFEVRARRPLTEHELSEVRSTLGDKSQEIHKKTLYSMAMSPTNQSLSEVVAIQEGYPMYGFIDLQKKGRIESHQTSHFVIGSRAWLEASLCLQLGLKIGDTFKLGHETLTVDDIIVDESSVKWQGASLAPRMYISHQSLGRAQLISKGSIVWYSYLYRVEGEDSRLSKMQAHLNKKLDDPQIKVQTHISSGQDNGRILKYLSDYLSLVALTALALAGLGSSYLFRSYLSQKRKDIAILISIGLTHGQTISLYIIKLAILGALASIVSFGISSLILPLAGSAIGDLTPLTFTPTIGFKTLLYTLFLAVGYAIFICLPVILQIRRIKPAELFQEELDDYHPISKSSLVSLIPAAAGFYLLAISQANSILVGSVFCGVIILIAFTFSFLGLGLIRLSKHLSPESISFKLALRYVQRRQTEVMLGFLALAIGSTLISLIPSIRHGIEQEIMTPDGQQNRSLFMFDIQEEQKEPIEQMIRTYGVETLMSPMIRARLTKVNGKVFQKQHDKGKTRETQESGRMRNRGVNLSYRAELAPSESIADGRQFTFVEKDGPGPYEITLEQRYAGRLGLKLGDQLTFEVQSIPIEGKVVGLRKVKWNSFDPNFFIQFQPGALEDAPKTFVAAIPKLTADDKLQLQKELVKTFKNVSIIDVTKLLSKILAIINQMSWVLFLMAILSVISGFVVLFSIANHQAQLRQGDTNLLKILGLSFKKIQRAMLSEFILIAGSAALIGTTTSILLAMFMDVLLFTGNLTVNLVTPGLLLVAIIGVSLITAWAATQRRLKEKPSLHLG